MLILRGEGDLWHIRVGGLQRKNPHVAGDVQTALPHSAISAEALRASATGLIEQGVTLPADQRGYEIWREAYERGEAGVYSLEVADSVSALDVLLSAPPTPEENPPSQNNTLK